MGGSSGALGDALGFQYPTAGGGLTQAFQNGRIHWSPATGAHAVLTPLAGEYDSLAGESGPLGYPIGDRYSTWGNGWTQAFQNGRIHYSPTTGAHAVLAPISAAYDALLGESGALGYPTGDRYATWGNGWTQGFQNGRIHYSPTTGTHAVLAPISAAYDALLGESGALGYPTGDRYATAGSGWTQSFQNGRIHWTQATGAHAVIDSISTAYDALGGEAGVLGYPTGDRYPTPNSGWTQAFQNGRIHYSPTTGAHAVLAPISAPYDAMQGESGALGYPTGEQYATPSGGTAQHFENGVMIVAPGGTATLVLDAIGRFYAGLGGATSALGEPSGALQGSSASGFTQSFQNGRVLDGPDTTPHAVLGPMLVAYDAAGAQAGALGWPTSEQTVAASGTVFQRFENGYLVVTGAGARTVLGDLADGWQGLGAADGALGDPTGNRTAIPSGGWQQAFTGGTLLTTPGTGTSAVLGDIATAYAAAGGPTGPLGAPVGSRYATPSSGWTQAFQNGRIHYSPTTGAHAVLAPLSAAYDALMGESGVLGYPTGDRTATAGSGWAQTFQNGRLSWSATTGARTVLGQIATAYAALGGEAGSLGYPTGDRYPTPNNGWTQAFQNGRIHYSPTTGAHAVLAPISAAYDALTGESGALGYPTGERYATPNGGWTQAFQKGRIHYSPTTGAHAVLAPISGAYDALMGESGALGYPTGDRYPTPNNGWTQAFQNGRIHYSPTTGAHAVLAPISGAYDALMGESGALGYPTGDRYPTPNNGWTQAFQNGRIHYSPTTGAYAVLAPISAAYDSVRGESGVLGYPTGSVVTRADGSKVQQFEHGTITWTARGGAVVTTQ
nr:hypothetical protein [Petropleomorpha daqingensis]